jgi:hypothetical protein
VIYSIINISFLPDAEVDSLRKYTFRVLQQVKKENIFEKEV